MNGGALTEKELDMYKGFLLTNLGRLYHKHNIAMQLHIKALRNNSKRMFRALGADTGFDSMNDFAFAPMLGAFLNDMDEDDALPKTVLYSLNPGDNPMLASMAGNFAAPGIRSKVQFGTAWWFNDHKYGMKSQLATLSSIGMLSTFIGMLTDSRSFSSFPRHEYYRRILCQKLGELVEDGQYPVDEKTLGRIVEKVCGENAKAFFGF